MVFLPKWVKAGLSVDRQVEKKSYSLPQGEVNWSQSREVGAITGDKADI